MTMMTEHISLRVAPLVAIDSSGSDAPPKAKLPKLAAELSRGDPIH